MKKQFYRVKQLADQTFSRSGKAEALTDELQTADRKVEYLRNALQILSKRLSTGAGSTQGQDPAAREKRLKKLPEYLLGLSMCEASNSDDDDSILKYILYECGKTEKFLANEIAEHELKVEQLVCAPLTAISDQDLPTIMKSKKHLVRLINEKESAASKYHYLERQKEENPTKLNAARDELEDAGAKVEAARDVLAADMFALVAKEAQLAHTLLQYVKLQRAYHESALHSLQDTVPELERFINDSSVKPVFGYPLQEHLRVTGRTIAFPIELCVCTLHELALSEEGLFRIAGGASKVRRMKLSLDAGLFTVPLPRDYRDMHVVASVLKSYLRELPEPLLTFRLYEAFLNASKQPTEQARLTALWEAIHLLPDANFQNLRYLIKFLSELTQNQSTNKMTPSNLAIVIAPNLLWAVDESAFDMNVATVVNCVVELLIKHADWFFKDDVNFFVTFSREDLLPDQCEYGFTPSFVQGFPQTAALGQEQANGDHNSMSKSLYDASLQRSVVDGGGRHSRSNSHDTSLILLDNDMRKAQSNSSLSDQSSPPHGSPKPITRRKNKPLAPVPPNFTPKKPEEPTKEAPRDEKPAKPPRPVEVSKVISGVQTINRSTYKQSKALREAGARSGSRDDLMELRRRSSDAEEAGRGRGGPPPRPVAAPRTVLPDTEDVQLRNKPAVPERPATLRPASVRGRGSLDADTVLERAHVYSVDKQLPTLVTVGAAVAEDRIPVTRTHSSGGDEEGRALGSHSRALSQSEGSITDVPPSPRPANRPPRPTVPAPPPPTAPPTIPAQPVIPAQTVTTPAQTVTTPAQPVTIPTQPPPKPSQPPTVPTHPPAVASESTDL